jgi:hypothetical protein
LPAKKGQKTGKQIKFNASVRANGIAKILHTRHDKTFGGFPILPLKKL